MTHHQMKNPKEANEWFARAVERLERTANPPPSRTERLERQGLRDEAEALLNIKSVPNQAK
jgi:hypothetical protein